MPSLWCVKQFWNTPTLLSITFHIWTTVSLPSNCTLVNIMSRHFGAPPLPPLPGQFAAHASEAPHADMESTDGLVTKLLPRLTSTVLPIRTTVIPKSLLNFVTETVERKLKEATYDVMNCGMTEASAICSESQNDCGQDKIKSGTCKVYSPDIGEVSTTVQIHKYLHVTEEHGSHVKHELCQLNASLTAENNAEMTQLDTVSMQTLVYSEGIIASEIPQLAVDVGSVDQITKEHLGTDDDEYFTKEYPSYSTISEESFDNKTDLNVSMLFSDTVEKQGNVDSDGANSRKKQPPKKRKQWKDQDPVSEENQMKKPRKLPPNYFLSIQIGNEQIKRNLQFVQDHITDQDMTFKTVLVSPSKAHLTLFVIRLENNEDIERAQTALAACEDQLVEFLRENLVLTLESIGHFKDEVVFAEIGPQQGKERLQQIADIVAEVFQSHNITSPESKPFNPHVTLLKLSKARHVHLKNRIKKIPRQLYEPFVKATFGTQTVQSIQLCSMMEKGKNGYYKIIHEIPLVPADYTETCSNIPLQRVTKSNLPITTLNSPQTEFTNELIRNIKWITKE